MQGLIGAKHLVYHLVINVLANSLLQNIDLCLFGYRFILDFSGNEKVIQLSIAEILDSDWEIILDESKDFEIEISELVNYRNIEYGESLLREKHIRENRNMMF